MEYLRGVLESCADSVEVQRFEAVIADTTVPLWNLVAHFRGGDRETVLIGAHWDTRPWADEDPNPAKRREPVPGANDGASGVAVLLELARLLKERPPPRNVDLVLFDAEDSGNIGGWRWCMGSGVYARSLTDRRPDWAMVVDMVGDRDLEIFVETQSEKYAYAFVRKVWDAAENLGVPQFVRETRHNMHDDHVPLIAVGIPSVLIIDFDYPYWHTVADTPDKCSPASLEAVGRVLTAVVYGP